MARWLDEVKSMPLLEAGAAGVEIEPAVAVAIDRQNKGAILLFKESDAEILRAVADVHRKPFIALTPAQRHELCESLDYYNWIIRGKKGPRP
jgi:hypothetical protein